MTRFIAALVAAFLLASPASAQQPGGGNNDTSFSTPGNGFVQGVLQMCKSAANQAVPCTTGATGVAGYPPISTPITGSGTGTTTSTATLTAVAGKTTYICGLSVGVSGATAAGFGTVVVSGTITGSMNFGIAQVIVTADNQGQLTVPFTPCVPASATATNIVVTSTMGAGTTNNAVSAWGFNQ